MISSTSPPNRAKVLLHVDTIAKDIRGVRIVEQRTAPRHFTATFESLPNQPRSAVTRRGKTP
jgi:hypothetical protein